MSVRLRQEQEEQSRLIASASSTDVSNDVDSNPGDAENGDFTTQESPTTGCDTKPRASRSAPRRSTRSSASANRSKQPAKRGKR